MGAQQTLINYFTGDIAEVKIYSGVLSTPDRIAEEKALRCKYGLWDGTAQPDCDANGVPDECQPDGDGDGVIDACDNCAGVPNPDQGRHALDLDGDCDIDIEDVQAFVLCASGPEVAAVGQCLDSDVDDDGDVDQDDFGSLQRCMTGPGLAPDPTCAG
jgi:hypothetical protein